MAKKRIPTKPTELRDQLNQAEMGIVGAASWPTTAPPQLEVAATANALSTAITQVDALKAQLALARATLRTKRDTGVDTMKRIDEVTDGLYGPDGAEKLNFGLPPKKLSGVSVPLEQVVITQIEDGTSPASVFVDWDSEEGAAAYQIEWYTDSALTQQVGNAAISASEYEIAGLIAGQQYWIRVRAIRGNEAGQWSDPATSIANV